MARARHARIPDTKTIRSLHKIEMSDNSAPFYFNIEYYFRNDSVSSTPPKRNSVATHLLYPWSVFTCFLVVLPCFRLVVTIYRSSCEKHFIGGYNFTKAESRQASVLKTNLSLNQSHVQSAKIWLDVRTNLIFHSEYP